MNEKEIETIKKRILTKYPALLEGTQIIITKEISNVNCPGLKSLIINKEAAKFVSHFNGLKKIPEILDEILGRKPHPEEITNSISFLSQLAERKMIRFFKEPKEVRISIKGTFDRIYPQVINLELTNRCNYGCLYCFQNSSHKENKFLKEPLKVLEFFNNRNILGIELSGGEPTLHPQIEEILSYIVDNFSLLGLITNGSLIKEKHLKLLRSNTCKFAIQICLDGNSPEMVEATTGVKGSFEMEVNAIKIVKEHGLKLRVGMVIDNPQKIDVIEDTLLLAKELGADSFVPNPFIDFGRGKDLVDIFKPEDYLRLNNKIIELLRKYKGFISREVEMSKINYSTLRNCGAGHKNVVINWDGIIKPCPMVGAEVLSIGHWSEIDSEKVQDLFKTYFDLEAPKIEVCGECSYFHYCFNCITRALKAYDSNKDNCTWYKKNKILIEKIKR